MRKFADIRSISSGPGRAPPAMRVGRRSIGWSGLIRARLRNLGAVIKSFGAERAAKPSALNAAELGEGNHIDG